MFNDVFLRHVFTPPAQPTRCGTRLIFKWSTAGLDLKFFFSLPRLENSVCPIYPKPFCYYSAVKSKVFFTLNHNFLHYTKVNLYQIFLAVNEEK